MEYVMVPVPEDLVEDVDRFLKWIARRDAPPIGEEHARMAASTGAYLAVGPPARRVLATVAKAAVDQTPISLADAAAAVGVSLHEAMGMIGEANTKFVLLEGRGAMVFPVPNPEPIAEDCPDWAHNALFMPRDVAQTLLDL